MVSENNLNPVMIEPPSSSGVRNWKVIDVLVEET